MPKCKLVDTKQAERDACIYHIKKIDNNRFSENFINTLIDIIQKDGLIKFIILQFPAENYDIIGYPTVIPPSALIGPPTVIPPSALIGPPTVLQLLFDMFKGNKYFKKILNYDMANLLLASITYPKSYLEMCKWYNEFGYDPEIMNENIMAILYTASMKNPLTQPYIHKLYKTMNMKEFILSRTIYYVNDDVNIIIPYLEKDKILKDKATTIGKSNPVRINMNKMVLRCFQYDSINTLMRIHKELKLPFYNMTWYMLGVMAFYKVCEIYNKNPHEDEIFMLDMMHNICIMSRWDYLPTLVPKLSETMWKVIKINFYTGVYELNFVITLLHLMKKNNIPITKLVDKTYKFISDSSYINYLKTNNLYELFSTDDRKDKLIEFKNPYVTPDILETTLTSVTTLFGIYNDKTIDSFMELCYEGGIYMSNKYLQEIEYIDTLLYDNLLGWTEPIIASYNQFKILCQSIIDDGKITQTLTAKYNSYYVMENMHTFPELYKLRFLNKIINMYYELKLDIYKNRLKIIFINAMNTKLDILKVIRPIYRSKTKDRELFILPSERPINIDESPQHNDIFDHFEHLIENYDNIGESDKCIEEYIIDMVKENKHIQSNVRFMLYRCFVPISEIIKVLYNYWGYYTKEECYFLE